MMFHLAPAAQKKNEFSIYPSTFGQAVLLLA